VEQGTQAHSKSKTAVIMSCSTGTLASLCTPANLAMLFSSFTDLPTVVYNTDAISAILVNNYTNTPKATAPLWPATEGVSFCNVTVSYSHINLQDQVCLCSCP